MYHHNITTDSLSSLVRFSVGDYHCIQSVNVAYNSSTSGFNTPMEYVCYNVCLWVFLGKYMHGVPSSALYSCNMSRYTRESQ